MEIKEIFKKQGNIKLLQQYWKDESLFYCNSRILFVG